MTLPPADCLPPGLTEPAEDVTAQVSEQQRGCALVPAEQVRAFDAVPGQVRVARGFLASVIGDCPVADEVILCLSELASNCVLHSASREPGGTFTVRAQIAPGNYVRIEVRDDGGPWRQRPAGDDRPHGLDIVHSLAAESGVDGDAVAGWHAWAVLAWSGSAAD